MTKINKSGKIHNILLICLLGFASISLINLSKVDAMQINSKGKQSTGLKDDPYAASKEAAKLMVKYKADTILNW
jgi:hypothetical protein